MARITERSKALAPVRNALHRRPPVHRAAVAVVEFVRRLLVRTHLKELGVYGRACTRRLLGGGRRAPTTRFVIYGQGRSGSSLLLDLIASHPDVYCESEIFNRKVAARLFSPWRYIASRASLSRRAAYGCKLKIYQLTEDQGIENPRQFLLDLHEEGWKFVFLVRTDLLRKALSLAVAEARGRFLDRSAEGPVDLAPVVVDPEELVGIMRERDHYGRREEEALDGIPHVRVTYESDLRDPDRHQETCDRVFDYLELDRVRVDTKLARTSRRQVADYVTNYADLMDAIRQTEYAEFLPTD